MATEPHPGILDRELMRVLDPKTLRLSESILEEIVNYSTNSLVACEDSAEGAPEDHFAVMSLFRSAIGLVDGLHVLIANCCVEPTFITIRSLFEHLLGIEYLLQTTSDYHRRNLAWSVFRMMERVRFIDQLLPDTDPGKVFLKLSKDDLIVGRTEFSFAEEELLEERKRGLKLLREPYFAEAYTEYMRKRPVRGKKKRIRYTSWYQLFGGPQGVKDVAVAVKRGAMYSLLYTGWSRYSHGTDTLPFSFNGNALVFRRLREPKRMEEQVTFAVVFLIRNIEVVTHKFRPGDEGWKLWYKREIEGPMGVLGQRV